MATEQDDWRPIARVDASTPGFPAAGVIGDIDVVVWSTAAGYRATARACPHQYIDLLAGSLIEGGATVRCPLHGFAFRLSDGEGVNCPGFTLRVYDVIERDGALFARAVP